MSLENSPLYGVTLCPGKDSTEATHAVEAHFEDGSVDSLTELFPLRGAPAGGLCCLALLMPCSSAPHLALQTLHMCIGLHAPLA